MRLPQIPLYPQPEGISVTYNRTRTARPAQGLTTYAAQEMAFNSIRQGLDNLVDYLWADHSIWQIANICSEHLSVTISPKEVYSSHLRTKRELAAIDRNRGEGAD